MSSHSAKKPFIWTAVLLAAAVLFWAVRRERMSSTGALQPGLNRPQVEREMGSADKTDFFVQEGSEPPYHFEVHALKAPSPEAVCAVAVFDYYGSAAEMLYGAKPPAGRTEDRLVYPVLFIKETEVADAETVLTGAFPFLKQSAAETISNNIRKLRTQVQNVK